MPDRLEPFRNVGLDEALLALVIDEHLRATLPRLERLWTYYRNPVEPGASGWADPPGSRPGRRYRLGQEAGLPERLVGRRDVASDDRSAARREVVIENDIAWRVQSMVDFMFGRPLVLTSTARDERVRGAVERLLDAVWEHSGGIALLQDLALLGHVYGHVDLLLRADPELREVGVRGPVAAADAAHDIARHLRIEVVDPTRGIPILNPADYRRLDAYVVHFQRQLNAVEQERSLRRWMPWHAHGVRGQRRVIGVTEIFSAEHWQAYEDERLVAEGPNLAGGQEPPVVHIQNISQPLRYAGLGEVEPLIPLQDELNTRLSDRASRVTMQSFKMYLAKGVDGFDRAPVGPGQIWSTDNMEARIEAFGGDAASPSEDRHIDEIREALDKASGIPPIAGGVVRAKIGNLSSATALRITLMGVLAKTARKRVTYGRGIERMCRLVLGALDAAGILRTDEADRGVSLQWPDPLPVDLSEQIQAARVKEELGVPRERVLAELGYAPVDAGVA